MSDEVLDELRSLRARAYGPDADIADDPAALARLAELEDQQQKAFSRATTVAADGSARADEDAADADAEVDERPDAVVGPNTDAEPRRRVRPAIVSRRVVWLWAVSLALVAALSSALASASVSFLPVPVSAGVPQIATLTPDTGRALPGIFGPASSEGRAYPDFFGMTAFVAYAQFGPEGERNACVFLTPTSTLDDLDTAGYASGFSQSGCGAGVFPATAQFVVNSAAPDEFAARFPPGSSVQFVFDGENLGVFSDAG